MKSIELDETEKALKYIYDNHITKDNLLSHEQELRAFFHDDASYQSVVDEFMKPFDVLNGCFYMRPEQHIDAFPHMRYHFGRPHTHDFLEIKFLLKGNCSMQFGEEAFFMQESDMCLIAPYTPHLSQIFDSDSYMINIAVKPESISALFSKILPLGGPVCDFLKESQKKTDIGIRYLYLPGSLNENISEAARKILNYYRSDGKFSPIEDLESEMTLESAILNVLKSLPAGGRDAETDQRYKKQVKATMDFIENNLVDVSLETLAQHFHISTSYASRFIRKSTGKNFSDILQFFRIKKAAELLYSTDLNIDEIMLRVGYSGKTCFYNNFRKYYQMTPRDYRRQSQE